MRDDTTGEQTDEPAAAGGAEPTPQELRRRLEQRLGGRPLMVYLVLLAGGAALLLLLIIVWISATDDDDGERPACIPVRQNEAVDMIRAGQVKRMDVVHAQDRPEAGPAIVRLELNDERCFQLPEGADHLETLFVVLGAGTYFNEYAEQRIDIRYPEQPLPSSLLVTSTPEPTVPPTPTATATARPASPTAV
ncbi:MAG: hypothetical protein ACRDJH_03620, partial [Thermomicrobiales bacterium]